MAKKHKNLDNILIQWDGDLSKPSDGSAQSAPDNVDLGTWSGNPTTGYVTCWADGDFSSCVIENMYFEDFDLTENGIIDASDSVNWIINGRTDIATYISDNVSTINDTTVKGRVPNYTWGDVSFVIEIADGLGTGSRRSREARLQQLDKDKKKRLIRLICRVKGELVYDEEKEVGDVHIKLEDAELVINEVLGTIKVEKADVL